jgi:hypothetical protein
MIEKVCDELHIGFKYNMNKEPCGLSISCAEEMSLPTINSRNLIMAV